MIRPRLVLCSGAQVPEQDSLRQGRRIVELDTLNPDSNTHLRIENVTDAFAQLLRPRLVDLLELATYVYTADCEASRERAWMDDKATEPWSRDFQFVMPVRDLEFWTRREVQQSLVAALDFLSSDHFAFKFRQLDKERSIQYYLQMEDIEDSPFYEVERVIMFSGGLDSFAGAVETAAKGDRLVLVSHRPAAKINKRQRDLAQSLRGRFPVPTLHIPVWVNKRKLDRESTQRTRSFLFSALGTCVASVLRARGVRFYENGVTSLNWPLAAEVLQSRASRMTHPEALQRLQMFYRLITENGGFALDDPYVFQTKTEVVSIIAQHGAADLIPQTCSCVHTMFQSRARRHCGRCSQCIDRRIAIVAAGLAEYDSEDDYESDVFTGPRKEDYDRKIAVNYARFAREVDRASDMQIIEAHNRELNRAAQCFPSPSDAAQEFIDMYRRHARAVCRVLAAGIEQHSRELLDGNLDRTSLLRMIGRGEHLGEPAEVGVSVVGRPAAKQTMFRKTGDYWTVVFDGGLVLVKDMKGMHMIAYLLAHPHRAFAAAELRLCTGGEAPAPATVPTTAAAGLAGSGLVGAEEMGRDEIMDADYRRDVRRMIKQFDEELAEAERSGDPDLISAAKQKKQRFHESVAGALGKGGRSRKFRDDTDRVVDAVQKGVARALARLEALHPALHAHLRNSLEVGAVLSYRPDRHIDWLTG